MSESSDVDDLIDNCLDWLGKFLMKHFKLTRQQIIRKIRERLEVTI